MCKYAILCHIYWMERATTVSRLKRLDLLAARLQTDAPLVLRDIAAELGVSVRTLSRDIEVLRDRGLPIEADRGRGGGVRLHWSWGIGQISLSYREAVDLLVSLAVAERMESPILMANLASIRRKLMTTFSPADQQRVKRLKSRILIGQTASLFVQTSYRLPAASTIEKLHRAFLMSRVVNIGYEDERGRRTRRSIEPHYLLLNYPVWYLLSWDRLREDIRTFRCDRILSASLRDEEFVLRGYAEFRSALQDVDIVLP